MSVAVEQYGIRTETRYLGPGRVLAVDQAAGRAKVLLHEGPDQGPRWAALGMLGLPQICRGDTVLVLGEASEQMYVLGLLARNEEHPKPNRITLDGGAYAQTSPGSGSQKLQVFSDTDALLFEYDAKEGKARVNVESGDLEFIVQNGDIAFKSARKISFQGDSVEMQGRSRVRLSTTGVLGRVLSGLTLRRRRMDLQALELGVTSQRAAFQIDEAEYSGRSLRAHLSHLKLIARKVETMAQSVIAKAKNVYQTVEELTQLRTGRLRSLIRSTFQVKSRNAYLDAEEDFKVKADKIHLG
jgi:hypothetical protein